MASTIRYICLTYSPLLHQPDPARSKDVSYESKKMKIQKIQLLFVGLLLSSTLLYGQESDFSNSSLKAGIGIGINEGEREIGMGTLFFFGYQKSMWKDRLRINPNLTIGGFTPFTITDTRDQYYRITSLGINGYLDALKYKSVSIFVGTGAFLNYSRGLLGTGGWPEAGNSSSEYFFKLYYGGYVGAGLRINPTNSRFAYELAPINVQLGNNRFVLGFLKFGIDIKLKKQ